MHLYLSGAGHIPVVFLEGRVSDGDVVVAVPVGPDPVERRALLVLQQPRGQPEVISEMRSMWACGEYKLGGGGRGPNDMNSDRRRSVAANFSTGGTNN